MKLFDTGKSWSHRVAHAGIWSFALQFAEQLCVFGRVFVVAVLLLPRDFGLYNMATLTFVALDAVSRIGFEQALIQKKEDIAPYFEVAWTVRFIRGLLLALVLFLAAPWASAYFMEPDSLAFIRTISLSFVFQGCLNIGVVTFQKNLEFHKEFAYRCSGALIDLVVTVLAAYWFRNTWALVLGYLAADLARVVVSYRLHPFRPRFRFEWVKVREMFSYGVWVFLFGIAVFVGENGAGVIIGRIIGAASLGFFQLASRITGLSVRQLGFTIHRVAFPAYAELQESTDHMREAYQKIAGVSAVLAIPTAAGIFSMGSDFTRIFLGAKWMPMVPVLLILAVSSLIASITWTGRPAFMGRGQPETVFYMHLALSATLVVLIYPLASRWGIIGGAAAMLLSNTAALAVWYLNIRPQIGVAAKDLSLLFSPPLIASALMAAALAGLRFLTVPLLPARHIWHVLWFAGMILAGAAIYVALIFLFQRWLKNYTPLNRIARIIMG
jgi:O-antigen/teichoic acid export membrane protein